MIVVCDYDNKDEAFVYYRTPLLSNENSGDKMENLFKLFWKFEVIIYLCTRN